MGASDLIATRYQSKYDGNISHRFWERIGSEVDDKLEALGYTPTCVEGNFSIIADAGVCYFHVLGTCGNSSLPIPNQFIDKQKDETFEQAFLRNSKDGDLEDVSFGQGLSITPPIGDGSDYVRYSGSGLHLGFSLGTVIAEIEGWGFSCFGSVCHPNRNQDGSW